MGVNVNPISGGGGLSAPIDAINIADGSVSSTEFQYLNGVTSNIQTQIDDAGSGWIEQELTANSTLTNVTTKTEVSGFSFNLEANSTYIYAGDLIADNGQVAAGLDMYIENANGDVCTVWTQSGVGFYSQTAIRTRAGETASTNSRFFFNETNGTINLCSKMIVAGGFTTGSNTPRMILSARLNGSSTGVITVYKGSRIKFKKIA